MEELYPYRENRAHTMYVNIPDNGRYHQLNTTVSQTITITATSVAHIWTTNGLRRAISRRYGGIMADYPTFHHSRSTILLTLPARLNREQLLQQCSPWAAQNGLALSPYFDHTIPFLAPIYMIQIQILNYPLAYWDELYFQIITAGFGKYVQTHQSHSNAQDRSVLRVWIECRDPYSIPEYLILNFTNSWCRCWVLIDNWYPLGWTPPPPPPPLWPPEDPLAQTTTQQNNQQETPADLLFQCHKRVLRLWREGTPPAQADALLVPDKPPSADTSTCSGPTGSLEAVTTITRIREDEEMEHTQRWPESLAVHSIDYTLHGRTKPSGHGLLTTAIEEAGAAEIPVVVQETEERTDLLEHSKTIAWRQPTAYKTAKPKPLTLHSNQPTKLQGPINIQRKRISIPYPPSILGPHPKNPPPDANFHHFIPMDDFPSILTPQNFRLSFPSHNSDPTNFPTQPTQLSLRPLHPYPSSNPRFTPQLLAMDQSYEALIKKFDGLLQNKQPSSSLTISSDGCSSRNLSMCILVRLATDKPFQDQMLINHLINIWNVDPHTSFETLGNNIFLVEFTESKDLAHVFNKGPGLYRQDFLAIQHISSPNDLKNPTVPHMQIWVQLHNIPPGALAEEGILEIASKVGTPCSQIQTAFARGKKFYKVRVEREVNQPLPVSVLATLPSSESFTVYCTYEKLTRYCTFCALVGHERESCNDYAQLFRASLLPEYRNRSDLQQQLKKRIASWITSSAYLPADTHETHTPTSARQDSNQDHSNTSLKRAKSYTRQTPTILIAHTPHTDSMETELSSVDSPLKPPSKRTKAASGIARPLDI